MCGSRRETVETDTHIRKEGDARETEVKRESLKASIKLDL